MTRSGESSSSLSTVQQSLQPHWYALGPRIQASIGPHLFNGIGSASPVADWTQTVWPNNSSCPITSPAHASRSVLFKNVILDSPTSWCAQRKPLVARPARVPGRPGTAVVRDAVGMCPGRRRSAGGDGRSRCRLLRRGWKRRPHGRQCRLPRLPPERPRPASGVAATDPWMTPSVTSSRCV